MSQVSGIKRILQNISLLVCALIFSVFLCEGVFYILNLLSPPLREIETVEAELHPEWVAVVKYHPVYGHLGIPGIKKMIQGKHITHNSRGFRGPEVQYKREPGTKRVMFIGDSQIWGWNVADDETVTHYADLLFDKETIEPAYEVINLGVNGYCLGQSYLLFLAEGLRYHSDYVVLTYFADNDIWGTSAIEAWGVEKPYVFQKNDGSLCVSNVPPRRASGWPSDNLAYIVENRFGVEDLRISLPGFEFDLAGTQTFAYFKGRSINALLAKGWDDDASGVIGAIEEHIGCMQSEPGPLLIETQPQIDLVIKIIHEIHKMVEERSGKFLVVTKPTRDDYRHGRRGPDYQAVLTRLQQSGIKVIDIYSAGKEQNITDEQLFLGTSHLSAAGNRLIAESVVREILAPGDE